MIIHARARVKMPLEVAAGARLSTPEKASIARKRKALTNPNVNIERLWFYITYPRVCHRNFIYISILAKFVFLEYNHVVANTENQIFMICVERDSVLQY